jgi:hypothetical protein
VSSWNTLRADAKSTSQLRKIHLCALRRTYQLPMTILVRLRSIDQLSRAFPENVSAVEPLGVYRVRVRVPLLKPLPLFQNNRRAARYCLLIDQMLRVALRYTWKGEPERSADSA